MTAPGSPTGGPGGPTRRERREQAAKAGSRRRTIVVVVVILVVLAAGAAGWYFLVRDDDGSSSTTTTTSSSTTSSSSTTTSSSTSTSTTSTTVPAPPADPQAYAETLFSAWANGDRAAAATVADQAAIDSLFATPGSEAAAYTFSGCEGATGSIFCTWTRPGAQLAMTVRDSTGGLPVQVVEATIGS